MGDSGQPAKKCPVLLYTLYFNQKTEGIEPLWFPRFPNAASAGHKPGKMQSGEFERNMCIVPLSRFRGFMMGKMKRYIVEFVCYSDVSDVYVWAENEEDAIKKASWGMEGYPDAVTDVSTGITRWL